MAKVSLLGSRLARPGQKFVFSTPCDAAPTCPVARPCQNLDLGRTYEVVARRPIHHDSCTEHEGGVDAVEVRVLPIISSLEANKLRGTLAKWSRLVCTKRGCPNWDTCFNPAPRDEQEYRIVKTLGRLECPMGYRLERVELEERKSPAPA